LRRLACSSTCSWPNVKCTLNEFQHGDTAAHRSQPKELFH
jgi:hypothetical protein